MISPAHQAKSRPSHLLPTLNPGFLALRIPNHPRLQIIIILLLLTPIPLAIIILLFRLIILKGLALISFRHRLNQDRTLAGVFSEEVVVEIILVLVLGWERAMTFILLLLHLPWVNRRLHRSEILAPRETLIIRTHEDLHVVPRRLRVRLGLPDYRCLFQNEASIRVVDWHHPILPVGHRRLPRLLLPCMM